MIRKRDGFHALDSFETDSRGDLMKDVGYISTTILYITPLFDCVDPIVSVTIECWWRKKGNDNWTLMPSMVFTQAALDDRVRQIRASGAGDIVGFGKAGRQQRVKDEPHP